MTTFDPIALKARAQAETALSDFGAAPLDDGLAALCASLRAEAGLNASGAAAAERAIVATLSERLRLERWLAAHAEILDETLAPQVFVIGLPRTGTTALSQFMSEDPRARSIRRWEINSLTPPPDASVAVDPRLIATREAFAARDLAMPTLKTMLPIEAEDPSEHGPLLGLTARNLQLPTLYNTPSYARWLFAADLEPAYAYLAKALKLLQWKTPGAYWNLKNPPDIFAIEAIASAFP
ncbi:MAG: sulfotransferase, partial [Phenylobacterium sp.]|nr:sulfotransferase [Phenylobacterium sp.]